MTFQQTPASQIQLGETGYVVWDGGVVMAKYLEHQAQRGRLQLKGTRCVDLGSGCGVVGCVAAALNPGGVVLTDRFNLLKLLKANVAANHLHAKVRPRPPSSLHPDADDRRSPFRIGPPIEGQL
jgi:predicted RNA methylase